MTPKPTPYGAVIAWELRPGDDGDWHELSGRSWTVHCAGQGSCTIQGSNLGGEVGVTLADIHGKPLRLDPDSVACIGTPTRFVRPVYEGHGEPIIVSIMMRD